MSKIGDDNSNPGFSELCSALCDISSPNEMGDFLKEILTAAEIKDLALRWELMRRLKKGETQRQIAAELGISLCKITRGAKILKQNHSISTYYLNAEGRDESENSA